MTSVRMEDIIPLADDESHPNALDKVGNAKPALPLPEQEERKARLIAQILELQNTLQDLSQRVENVREESTRLRAENVVLGKYIKNLMRSTSLFQPTNSKEQPPKDFNNILNAGKTQLGTLSGIRLLLVCRKQF